MGDMRNHNSSNNTKSLDARKKKEKEIQHKNRSPYNLISCLSYRLYMVVQGLSHLESKNSLYYKFS